MDKAEVVFEKVGSFGKLLSIIPKTLKSSGPKKALESLGKSKARTNYAKNIKFKKNYAKSMASKKPLPKLTRKGSGMSRAREDAVMRIHLKRTGIL